ncbi:fetub [Pungitius sinensis]
MKHCMLLPLLLALGCMYVRAAPVAHEDIEEGSCEDASALGAAGLAITKINQDRVEGYVFRLHRLSNVHVTRHGESGTVFYLTLDVVETNCSVLSRKDWKACEARPTHDTPVYGQCKAAIYISRVHRVVRLYKYDCVIRPVPGGRVHSLCPGCPSPMGMQHAEVQKVVTLSLEKFNSENELPNRFSLLKVQRARAGVATGMYYIVEYTIQETNCTKSAASTDKCTHMEWDSAHKGFCKASIYHTLTGEAGKTDVKCDIYKPEAAEAEKKHHILGGAIGHRDTHAHSHDHDHDHAKSHTHHNNTRKHAGDSDHQGGSGHRLGRSPHHTPDHQVGSSHHHTKDHQVGSSHHHTKDHQVGSSHKHAHNHSHEHGPGHDHVHFHHGKNHSHGPGGVHEHDHDHDHTKNHTHHNTTRKHAEDSDHHHTRSPHHTPDHQVGSSHRHAHNHSHEHGPGHGHFPHGKNHSHGPGGVHEHHRRFYTTRAHDHPIGRVRVLPDMEQPMTLPSFPDAPVGGPVVGVTLPLKPDPQVPGQTEPTIRPFPKAISASCVPPPRGDSLVEKVFAEDPLFKPAA